jgi:serine/threonine-protein kinase
MVFRNDYGYDETIKKAPHFQLGLGRSDDGIHWKIDPKPILEGDNEEVLGSYDPRLIWMNGRFFITYTPWIKMAGSQTLEVPGFQVVQFIGSGAGSTLWQIKDRQTGRMFALKRVIKRSSEDMRFIEQAINEHAIGSKLSHPSLRQVISIRRVKRWLSLKEIHLVMEYCEGQSLQENQPHNVAQVVKIFNEVAAGLAYMNAKGFVHSDMKPNNIVVSPAGAVKIIDLGQSCPVGTVKARIQGTPDYIAPEQVHRRPLDARTDVYNFGASLYWVLTGKAIPTALPPRGSMTMPDPSIVPPEDINPQVPASLNKLVIDCIETQPKNRPGSMNEVASRLSLIGHTLRKNGQVAGHGQG